MADYNSHLTASLIFSITYAAVGAIALNIQPENVLLASVVFVVAGILPNIDSPDPSASKELVGVLGAVTPLAMFQFFPWLQVSSLSRIALFVISCYLGIRYLVSTVLSKFLVRRGMMHSVPAAVITAELIFLLFGDLIWRERLFIAAAAFGGFLLHLVQDAYTNAALNPKDRLPSSLKFRANTAAGTFFLYASVAFLGWFVLSDIYPQAHLQVPVKL